ncbi:MAG: hypothetical protein RMH84_03465 [Sulfolobales archaeon]|nr:hypothetical protein [Sulfolobales archaeon]MCX8209089.1 hypothetical protein [Sulfolobales archaeon]MDW8010635.1 hypothetical protein [Sulfolobales archaeon]
MIRLEVRDLNKLLKYVADLGYTITEGPHAVLEDSSEVGYWVITRESRVVGEIIAHYVDNHYYALVVSEGASNEEVLEALLRADRAERWRAPVEDVVVIGEEEILTALSKYVDEVPSEEAVEAVAHYERVGIKIVERFLQRLRVAYR